MTPTVEAAADPLLYEPDRRSRRLMGPLFGLLCLLATLSGVVVLALLLIAVVGTMLRGTEGSSLRLMAPGGSLDDFPMEGKDLIVVGEVGGKLQFRVFDSNASIVVDDSEASFSEKVRELEALKAGLAGAWPPRELPRVEASRLLGLVTAVVDRPLMRDRSAFEFLRDLARQMQDSDPRLAGFRTGIMGSLWLLGLVAIFAIPVGVGAAVFLEEYTPPGWFRRTIQINIANLAGVPSIVYGLLGLALFVDAFGFQTLGLGPSLLAGALTLGLLILPVIVIATQEALRTVPSSLRQAAMALGATRWQVVRDHVLPSAVPGILTGVILALSRAIGETAPLIMVGAAASIGMLPTGPSSRFTILPFEIYNAAKEPNRMFEAVAAGGILLLLALLLTMNAAAIFIRNRYARSSVG
jgi:phosphate transport system permease protein